MTTPWIAFHKPRPGARLRLFCFPFAGGSASVYRTWQQDMPAEIEVCPVQLPGRERRFREPAFTSLPPLIDEMSKALEPYFDLPFAFFGHSMGSIIGYELGHELRAEGKAEPVQLLVSARRAPHIPEDDDHYHELPDDELREKLGEIEGTPPEVLANAELMELMLPLIRSDFELNETYEYAEHETAPWPLTAFGGLEDPEVPREYLEEWEKMTSGPFRLRMFPGGHFYLNEGKDTLIAAVLEELLPRVPR